MRLAAWLQPAARWLEILQQAAWALFLLCLPVTSFPAFPPVLGGSALVRPLSLYPLLVLLVIFTLPRLLLRPAPRTLQTLLPFALVAVVTSALALLRGIDPALGISPIGRVARALLTLGLGAAVFYTTSLVPRCPEDLRRSLRWLYAGFAVALLWGTLQAVYVVYFNKSYFVFLNEIQSLISSRKLFTTRVSGLTYEPNWFGVQISALLLPWLLAAALSGYSVFRRRWRWLTAERLMLLWAVGVLAFTFSRAGLANLLGLSFIGLVFIRPAFRSAGRSAPRSAPGRTAAASRPAKPWWRRVLEAGLVLLVLIGGMTIAGRQNEFFSRLWNYWSSGKNTSLEGYITYIGFGARFVYGEAALRLYDDYPVLGVGMGNYAYYFAEYLPEQPLATMPEILRIISPEPGRDRLITPKNLYVRILAETGLVGLAAFAAFIIAVFGCALSLWLAADSEIKYFGAAGLLGMLAFGLSALSFDSFAVPNMWVVFGLLTAAAHIYREGERTF